MGSIKARFKEKADALAIDIKDILKDHGNKVIGEVQLSQIYQGMRGITTCAPDGKFASITSTKSSRTIQPLLL